MFSILKEVPNVGTAAERKLEGEYAPKLDADLNSI
jgi:hypothetical protein